MRSSHVATSNTLTTFGCASCAIVREVDRAHAAVAELRPDLVAIVDDRAGCEIEPGKRHRGSARRPRSECERGDRLAALCTAIEVQLDLAESARRERALDHGKQRFVVRAAHGASRSRSGARFEINSRIG